MKLVTAPPPEDWPTLLRHPSRPDRSALPTLAEAHVAALRAAPLLCTAPLIVTGHQAGLWHPGILAKDIAAVRAAQRLGTGACHVVVDQDVNAALTLDLPTLQDERLGVHRVTLAPTRADVPTGSQRPVDAATVLATLQRTKRELGPALAADLDPLMEAWKAAPSDCPSLAAQVTAVLLRLLEPLLGRLPIVMVSQLRQTRAFTGLVGRMLQEPRACVATYNTAARRRPEAGITPLRVEPDRLELPLWLTAFDQPRQRVFADIADRRTLLVSEDGRTLDLHRDELAPRALLLTALWRSGLCDLFIHGKGGGVYDRVTEDWWQSWTGRPLGAMAVVTADLTLPLAAPQAEPADLRRAQWRVHHLPHNLDRALKLDTPATRRKRELLAHMDDDRDARRRAVAFAELHAINDQLAAEHAEVLREAQRDCRRAAAGVTNRHLLARRDWSLALYPPARLAELLEAVDDRLTAVPARAMP